MRQKTSHRAVRLSGVSARHAGQSIFCRTSSSRAIMARSRSSPNRVTSARAASSPSASRSRSTSSVNSNRSVPAWAPSRTRKRGSMPGLDRVRPQERPAERVDRADAGRIEVPDQFQPVVGLVLGTLLQALVAGLADAVAHFAGCPLGEGDRHQLAQAGAAASWSFGRRTPVAALWSASGPIRPGTARSARASCRSRPRPRRRRTRRGR